MKLFFANEIVSNSNLELNKSTFHGHVMRRASAEPIQHIWKLLTWCLKSIRICLRELAILKPAECKILPFK